MILVIYVPLPLLSLSGRLFLSYIILLILFIDTSMDAYKVIIMLSYPLDLGLEVSILSL